MQVHVRTSQFLKKKQIHVGNQWNLKVVLLLHGSYTLRNMVAMFQFSKHVTTVFVIILHSGNSMGLVSWTLNSVLSTPMSFLKMLFKLTQVFHARYNLFFMYAQNFTFLPRKYLGAWQSKICCQKLILLVVMSNMRHSQFVTFTLLSPIVFFDIVPN